MLRDVDISFEPNQCSGKMQASHETSCQFVIASENASVPFDKEEKDVEFAR